MLKIEQSFDVAPAFARLKRLPADVDKRIEQAIARIESEGVRQAKREAPKGPDSLLVNGIHAERLGPHSVAIVAATKYAVYVHEGTGPAAGQASYLPNPANLYGYVKSRAGISFRNTKSGSRSRKVQTDEIRDRAWALAKYIQRHGTKPNPFMRRTAEHMAKRAPEILRQALERVEEGGQ